MDFFYLQAYYTQNSCQNYFCNIMYRKIGDNNYYKSEQLIDYGS